MTDIHVDDFRHGALAAPPLVPQNLRRAAGAVLFLLLIAGMAVWAYRLGTRDAGEIPIIRAMEPPARVQPEEPGGLEAAHQGLEVNAVLGGSLPTPIPVPTMPAAPVPPPVTLAEEDGPQGELVIAAREAATITLPEEQGTDLRMPHAEEGPLTGAEPFARPDPAAVDVTSLIQSLADDAPEAARPAAVEASPRPVGRPAGHAARAARPAETPQAASVPAPAAQPVPSAAPAASSGREVASVAPGTRLVQLGAFDSEGMARQTWGQLVGRHGDVLGAKSLFLERVTHNARVFYRLRVAGFAHSEETRVLCETLRARGVDCIPVQVN